MSEVTMREVLLADMYEKEIDILKKENKQKDDALNTDGKYAQWRKGYKAGQESAGFYYEQADAAIRAEKQGRKDDNAELTQQILDAEARAEIAEKKLKSWRDAYGEVKTELESLQAKLSRYQQGTESEGIVYYHEPTGKCLVTVEAPRELLEHDVRVLIMKEEV